MAAESPPLRTAPQQGPLPPGDTVLPAENSPPNKERRLVLDYSGMGLFEGGLPLEDRIRRLTGVPPNTPLPNPLPFPKEAGPDPPKQPTDLIVVKARARSVKLPFLNSLSISGPTATCDLVVLPGCSVPGQKNTATITIEYNDAEMRSPFRRGGVYIIRFRKNGEPYDVLPYGPPDGTTADPTSKN